MSSATKAERRAQFEALLDDNLRKIHALLNGGATHRVDATNEARSAFEAATQSADQVRRDALEEAAQAIESELGGYRSKEEDANLRLAAHVVRALAAFPAPETPRRIHLGVIQFYDHPEAHTTRWTEVEIGWIRDYAEAQVRADRLRYAAPRTMAAQPAARATIDAAKRIVREEFDRAPMLWKFSTPGDILNRLDVLTASPAPQVVRDEVHPEVSEREQALEGEAIRREFEQWYVENAFDYERNPLGSGLCGQQWFAYAAAKGLSKFEARRVLLDRMELAPRAAARDGEAE